MNSEKKVIDAIDELVNDSLAQPISDDYSVNHYEKCELCGDDWHGLPTMDDYLDRSCPGAWASDEAKATWREMFPALPAPSDLASDWPARLDDNGVASWTARLHWAASLRLWTPFDPRWRFTDVGRTAIFSRHIDLGSSTFRVKLFSRDSEIPDGGGYITGGLPVSLAISRPDSETVVVSFAANPVWTATGRGFTARYAGLVVNDTVIIYCYLHPDGIHVRHGTLTIDNDGCPSPLFTLQGIP